jgi:hypothetical protein
VDGDRGECGGFKPTFFLSKSMKAPKKIMESRNSKNPPYLPLKWRTNITSLAISQLHPFTV